MTRVLLIDDDEQLLELLAAYLRRLGHQVETATDGARGAQLFRERPFAVVVTDLVMPNREGLETIIQLRNEHPELPIVAMSGGVSRSKIYLELAKNLGANRTLLKPFGPSRLADAIAELAPPAAEPDRFPTG